MIFFRRIASAFFYRGASALLRLARWKRGVVYANLRHVSAAVPHEEAGLLYRRLLSNVSRHAGDLLFGFATYKKLPADTASFPCTCDGMKFALADGAAPVLEKMRDGGIFLTAHYGNYEAIGPWLCRLGVPLVASYIPVKPAWLNRILDKKIRAVDGRSYGVDARTPREFLRLLDEGKLFCLLADQDSRISSALPGKFLGQNAKMNPLPDFLLKHRPGTPVYVCWLEEGRNLRVLHAEEVPLQAREKSASLVIDEFNRWLESRIAENPALWYGFAHRRFYSVDSTIYRN